MALTREGAVYIWGNFEVKENGELIFGDSHVTKHPYKVQLQEDNIVSIAIGIFST
jgi:alpha-tubulin suppressor-like RCC1 family protein